MKPYVVLYAIVSTLGTAAYCLLWIDFTSPVLNGLWIVSMLVAGAFLGNRLYKDGVDDSLRPIMLAHALAALGVAAFSTTWPALVLVCGGDLPARPSAGVVISLLPLVLYAYPILRPRGTLQKISAALAVLIVILPCLGIAALWGIGSALFVPKGDPLHVRAVYAPGAPFIARHEVRQWGGGIFPDTHGRVWLEVPGLPLRQLVYQYWTDTGWDLPPAGVVRWTSFRRLEFTLPSDSHGGSAGPLLGFGARYRCEDDVPRR